MTRKALFLHGTSGSSNDHWWPWLKEQFERSGYDVWTPLLPDSHRPSEKKYWEFLHGSGWDFSDNVLVGHSSGATSVLNLLARPEFPKVKAAVLVGAFLNENLTKDSLDFTDKDQFAELFLPEGFDWPTIRVKAERFYFVHGDNDPYCAYDDATAAAQMVNGTVLKIPGGGHLSASSGIVELPELLELLRHDDVL